MIRAPIDQCLVVQGGPAPARPRSACTAPRTCCSSTAAGWSRDGVLVVGPNKVFLDYIGNVLPSLGERSVQQRTALDLCVPRVEIDGVDDDDARRCEGRAARCSSGSLAARVTRTSTLPTDDRARADRRAHAGGHAPTRSPAWIDAGARRRRRRSTGGATRCKASSQRELLRRTGPRRRVAAVAELRAALQQGVADAAADPARRPAAARARLRPGGKRRRVDGRRPVPGRRGQLAAQRPAVHVRPRRRRRGAGPLGRRAAGRSAGAARAAR